METRFQTDSNGHLDSKTCSNSSFSIQKKMKSNNVIDITVCVLKLNDLTSIPPLSFRVCETVASPSAVALALARMASASPDK